MKKLLIAVFVAALLVAALLVVLQPQEVHASRARLPTPVTSVFTVSVDNTAGQQALLVVQDGACASVEFDVVCDRTCSARAGNVAVDIKGLVWGTEQFTLYVATSVDYNFCTSNDFGSSVAIAGIDEPGMHKAIWIDKRTCVAGSAFHVISSASQSSIYGYQYVPDVLYAAMNILDIWGTAAKVVTFCVNTEPGPPPLPPSLLFRPLLEIVSPTADSTRVAVYTAEQHSVVYAPAGGVVESVMSNSVVISSTTALGRYMIMNVNAPTSLRSRNIEGGCALGYYDGSDRGLMVLTEHDVSPTVASLLVVTPTARSCASGYQCFTEVVRLETAGRITIVLPPRVWPPKWHELSFRSEAMTGSVLFHLRNPRPDTFVVLEVWEDIRQIGNTTLFQVPVDGQYVISPVQFVRGDNSLRFHLNPTGAVDVDKICISSLAGNDPVGLCPPPATGWLIGKDAEFGSAGEAILRSGWIWKEVTSFLPPGAPLPGGSGVQSLDVNPAAIYGQYENRFRIKPISTNPRVFFEKELAPGVWKTLDAVTVTQEAYYVFNIRFESNQQFLTVRVRSDGDVEISEICAEEEQRESEVVPQCFGIQAYNPRNLTCNLLECPVAHIVYQMQKLHDIAVLPPLCRIAEFLNKLYYHVLMTVGKPALMYLTTITELIREKGLARGIAEVFKVLLESLWVSLVKPYGSLILNWIWGWVQPIIDFLGISEYTIKLLQRFFSLLFRIFVRAFSILTGGTVGLIKQAWNGFKHGLATTPGAPPVPPESLQLGMELVGYGVGNILIIPLAVVFTGMIMWMFFFWLLRTLGIVK